MKKIIACFFMAFLAVGSFAQTVTLVFTGRDINDRYVQLDSVAITNVTKGWNVTITYPDTTLPMQDVTGIAVNLELPAFGLSQNNPNPFNGTTEVNLSVTEPGAVTMELADINGKIVETWVRSSIQPGVCQFCINVSTPGVYVLTARQNGKTSSVKMVNNGGRNANVIDLVATHAQSANFILKDNNEPFSYGDEMVYLGYAIYGSEIIESQPAGGNEVTNEDIVLVFPALTDGLPCPEAATVADFEGNVYNTVMIGNQCWMRENLRSTMFVGGIGISLETEASASLPFRYEPYGSAEYVNSYGYLYNWPAAMIGCASSTENPSGAQGLCPDGWHMPSDAEWTQLTDYLSSMTHYQCENNTDDIARALASFSEWASSATACAVGNSLDDNNLTNFSALPAGSFDGSYGALGETSYFWSATEEILPNETESTVAHVRFLNYNSETVGSELMDKAFGASVRCLRGASATPVTSELPTVQTAAVTDIAEMTATAGGNVTSDGGAAVTERGVCWSTSQIPTTDDLHTSDGEGVGTFTSSLGGLVEQTTYFVRAYATNSVGTAYGELVRFTTLASTPVASLPMVGTDFVTDITTNSAMCGGNVSDDGGAAVTAKGVCWSTAPEPTTADNFTVDGTGLGFFTSEMNNLVARTTYHVRAYATNSVGTAYGAEFEFTTDVPPCPNKPIVSDYDNNVYNTILMGNQCWMRENLKTTHYANGDPITLSTSNASSTTGYRYFPNSTSTTVATYGYLYNWQAVTRGISSNSAHPVVQGICPDGWHVPSHDEWTEMLDSVNAQSEYRCSGTSTMIAKALAFNAGWISSTTSCAIGNDQSANNATGFSVRPAGSFSSSCSALGGFAYFWQSTASSTDGYALCRGFNTNAWDVSTGMVLKSDGYSMRCVYDVPGTSATTPTTTTASVSGITTEAAICGGEVICEGGAAVTARGICWSTSPNPTLADNHTTDGSGLGTFVSSITGLTLGNTYYVRAYATNSEGTEYGNPVSFTTPNSNDGLPCPGVESVTDYDNNVYTTIRIGNQCWMKENMKAAHYSNGDPIPVGTDASLADGYCYYPDGNSANVSTYGYLYNWMAVMHNSASSSANPSGVQGVCPIGWHVPSSAEWTQLTDYVGSQSQYQCVNAQQIAKSLASNSGWTEYNVVDCAVGNDQGSNNATGFNALPAGDFCYGDSRYLGESTRFWTATSGGSYSANTRGISYFYAIVSSNSDSVNSGYSVRCVKD